MLEIAKIRIFKVFFDGKPDADTRAELKSSGFRWAPSVGAWHLLQPKYTNPATGYRYYYVNQLHFIDRIKYLQKLGLSLFHLYLAQHHFGVFDKISVHRNTVFVCIKVYP